MALTLGLPDGPVLVVAPHPDDELIGCGGVLAAHRERGDDVRVLVIFDGALGDPDQRFGTPAQCAARRVEEARAGGRHLGLTDYVFLGLPEGHRASTAQLETGAARIATEAQRMRARCIYAPAVTDAHFDHYQTALAVELALERLGPTIEAWGFEVETPVRADRLFAIDAFAERKWAALAEHVSQIAYRDLVAAASRTARLRAARLVGVEAVEAFQRLHARAERQAG
jgi:LmbE family N-acetylglucosaminyl deacetylase